jgi:hypothetical protein
MTRKTLITNSLIWLALTIASAAFAIKSLDWMDYNYLVKRGVAVKATVTAKEPDNHRFIRYSYSVDQKTYNGLGSAGHGNPRFEELNVGDKVTVVYDPVNPDLSFLGDPKDQLNSVTGGVIFITLIFPFFSIIAIHIIRTKLNI